MEIVTHIKSQHLGVTVREALKNNRITISSAAFLLGISRAALNSRLNNGKFFYTEIYKLHKHKIL